jgi:hypothetical protein
LKLPEFKTGILIAGCQPSYKSWCDSLTFEVGEYITLKQNSSDVAKKVEKLCLNLFQSESQSESQSDY